MGCCLYLSAGSSDQLYVVATSGTIPVLLGVSSRVTHPFPGASLEEFILAHSPRTGPYGREVWQQELEEAGHIVSAVMEAENGKYLYFSLFLCPWNGAAHIWGAHLNKLNLHNPSQT